MLLSKKELRATLLRRRKGLDTNYRLEKDIKIYNSLMELTEIAEAETVFTYVSTEIEVDTILFIEAMLECGKTVAVPKCQGKTMRFIAINSLSDLQKGAFGIFEPTNGEEITDFRRSVCITPALSFDENGFRMGYGGGYYDRFLSEYTGLSIGICYEDFIGEITTEEYDLPVNIVVTEEKIRYTDTAK